MTANTERPPTEGSRRPRGPCRRVQLLVSGLLVLWLGAQVVVGWKFANGVTYPVVGSAMFNGPPNGAGRRLHGPPGVRHHGVGRAHRDGPAHVRPRAVRVAAMDQAPPRGRRRRPRRARSPDQLADVVRRRAAGDAGGRHHRGVAGPAPSTSTSQHGRTDPAGGAVTASLAGARHAQRSGPVDLVDAGAGSGSTPSRRPVSACCGSGCSASCSSTSSLRKEVSRGDGRHAAPLLAPGRARRGCSTRSASAHPDALADPHRAGRAPGARRRRPHRLALPLRRTGGRGPVPLLAVPRSVVGRDEARPRHASCSGSLFLCHVSADQRRSVGSLLARVRSAAPDPPSSPDRIPTSPPPTGPGRCGRSRSASPSSTSCRATPSCARSASTGCGATRCARRSRTRPHPARRPPSGSGCSTTPGSS